VAVQLEIDVAPGVESTVEAAAHYIVAEPLTNVTGSGLHGLAERAEALGGRLLVSSRAGAGTTAHAELPA
jgi:glucose-6-phosphate-specific signal transduction histidine kinase